MGRILIADDENFCLESLKIMLKKAQINIDE
jgi:YesN/AraC family two-component response regulator